jgi:hypothetical protein
MVEADASEAEAVLNALSDDEASKLRILDYLRKWLGDELEDCQPIASSDSAMESIMMGWCDMGSQIGPQVLKPVHLSYGNSVLKRLVISRMIGRMSVANCAARPTSARIRHGAPLTSPGRLTVQARPVCSERELLRF